MGSVRVEISEKIPDEVLAFIAKNEEAVARPVEARAVSTTAFRDETGKLRKSIKALKSKYEGGGWIVRAKAPHAHLVEFGHGGKNPAPAHAFLRPALEAEIEEAKMIFGAK